MEFGTGGGGDDGFGLCDVIGSTAREYVGNGVMDSAGFGEEEGRGDDDRDGDGEMEADGGLDEGFAPAAAAGIEGEEDGVGVEVGLGF